MNYLPGDNLSGGFRHTLLKESTVKNIEKGRCLTEISFNQDYTVVDVGQIDLGGTEYCLVLMPSFVTDEYNQQFKSLYGRDFPGALIKTDFDQVLKVYDNVSATESFVDIGSEFISRLTSGSVLRGDSITFAKDSTSNQLSVVHSRDGKSLVFKTDYHRKQSFKERALIDYKLMQEDIQASREEFGEAMVSAEDPVEGINVVTGEFACVELPKGERLPFKVIDEGDNYFGEFDVVVYTPKGPIAACKEDFDFSEAKVGPADYDFNFEMSI